MGQMSKFLPSSWALAQPIHEYEYVSPLDACMHHTVDEIHENTKHPSIAPSKSIVIFPMANVGNVITHSIDPISKSSDTQKVDITISKALSISQTPRSLS